MARFVVDVGTALRIVSEGIRVGESHRLLAPTLLRSQLLSRLHAAVARGELPVSVARERVASIRALDIRLLGDAVLQRRAWEIADRLGWAETYDAEYIALAAVQRCTLIAADARIARAAEELVPTAGIVALE